MQAREIFDMLQLHASGTLSRANTQARLQAQFLQVHGLQRHALNSHHAVKPCMAAAVKAEMRPASTC